MVRVDLDISQTMAVTICTVSFIIFLGVFAYIRASDTAYEDRLTKLVENADTVELVCSDNPYGSDHGCSMLMLNQALERKDAVIKILVDQLVEKNNGN